jgi:hypothetical protein
MPFPRPALATSPPPSLAPPSPAVGTAPAGLHAAMQSLAQQAVTNANRHARATRRGLGVTLMAHRAH